MRLSRQRQLHVPGRDDSFVALLPGGDVTISTLALTALLAGGVAGTSAQAGFAAEDAVLAALLAFPFGLLPASGLLAEERACAAGLDGPAGEFKPWVKTKWTHQS